MVPQPVHGVPGYLIPRKRVGAGGGMWVLGNNLATREHWDDASMCRKTGARDFEKSGAIYSNLDAGCNNPLESCTTESGVNVGTSLCEGKETEGQSIEHVMDTTTLPPEDHTYDMRNLIEAGSGNKFSNSISVPKQDDENYKTSYGVEVKDVASPGDDDEPDIAFDDLYNLLESEPSVPQDAELLSQKTIDNHEVSTYGVLEEAVEFHGEGLEDRLSLFMSPHNEDVDKFDTESHMQEKDEIGFLFFPSSAQEGLQSGTGSSSRSTNEHEFLSLSSSAQESSQGVSVGFFRQSDNDSLLLLSSPDEDSWHSAPSRLHNGYEGITSERSLQQHSFGIISLDMPKPEGLSRSLGSTSQIDHKRPIQNYGSVLASSTKFPGNISALDCTSMICPTSTSIGRFSKASSVPSAYVDLTEDSDEDDDVEFLSPSSYGGVLGKRRTEEVYEVERKKRLAIAAVAGSSDLWMKKSGPKVQTPIFSQDWSRQAVDKLQNIKMYNSFGVVEPRPLHWDLPDPSYYLQESPSLISNFNSNMAGGRNMQSSDREGSTHVSLSYDMDHNRTFFGNQSVPSLLSNPCGQTNSIFSASREEKTGKALKAVLQQTAMVDNTKETTPDPGLLSVELLKHQRIALNWMEEREAKKGLPYGGILADDQGLGKTISTISLILKVRAPVRKRAVEASNSPPPEAATVDLGDDDDLHSVGVNPVNTSTSEKTNSSRQPTEGSVDKGMKHGGNRISEDVKVIGSKGRPAAGTLVVCPTSVLRQWGHELKEKVTQSAELSVLVYHGGNRTKDPEELAKYDVVLTTYSIVSMEVPKQPLPDEKDVDKKNPGDFDVPPFRPAKAKKPKMTGDNAKKTRGNGKGRLVEGENGSVDSGPLARVNWFRVVLDEAQSIKNARTQVARAAWGLRAKRRWCLSGTPIQNAIDDLYSYFRFLRYAPYDGYKTFREKIKDPVTRTPAEGYKALQSLLSAVMLRRTKDTLIDGKPIVNLPGRIVTLKQTEFSEDERAFYTNLETESRKQFQDYADAGTLQSNYVNILWMLLRLRQACDHPLLVKGHKAQGAQKIVMGSARALSAEQRLQLLNLLESNRAICPLCNDPPDDAVVCICAHIFCRQCISEQLATGDDNGCPVPKCRKPLNLSLVFTLGSLKSCEGDESNSTLSGLVAEGTPGDGLNLEETGWKSSSKINAVIDTLSALPKVIVVLENGKVVAEVSKNLEDVKLVNTSNVRIANLEPSLSEVVILPEAKIPTSDIKAENAPCSSESIQNSNSLTKEMPEDNTGVKQDATDLVKCKDTVTRVFVESTEKAIVFSQWTSMLDLLEISLKQAKFNYRRLDGTMSVLARDRAVAEFKTLPEVTVIIMSLKAASLGLNMVAACHVLLLDVWWNPTTEDQAIDRAHRIGQKRTVRVSRFTVKNTIEDRILALQERKRQIVASAFGEGEAGGQKTTRLSAADLEYLFRL